jgi:predicted heme/steroid binding protein
MKRYIYTIVSASIIVFALAACTEKLEPVFEFPAEYQKLEFSAKSGRVAIPVKSNFKSGVQVSTDDYWYQCAVQNDTVIVLVDKNTGSQPRKGIITIDGVGEKYEIEIEQATGEYNTVYIAGHYKDGDVTIAALWKDGEVEPLSQARSVANAVFVYNGDVYVSGCEYGTDNKSKAVLWKNGQRQLLPSHSSEFETSYAQSVYVYGNNVYVAGYARYDEKGGSPTGGTWSHLHALLWTNGEATHLYGDGYYDRTQANSVYVDAANVSIAGYTYEESLNYPYTPRNRAACWGNSGYDRLLSGFDNSRTSYAYSVYGDYVAGSYDGRPVYWNISSGDLTSLNTDGKSGMATTVFYKNGTAYIAGYVDDYAVLWKNGTKQQLSNAESRVWLVFVTDENDVYACGSEASVSVLWKNGKKQSIKDFVPSSFDKALFID